MISTTQLNEDELALFNGLCLASKEGDLEKVENLVDNFGAPINGIDEWQCSPLYWACLCGHYSVAKFLLEHGAQCDRNTFQGERCLYGALTNDIRDLLLSYKITKAIDENQPYLLFLTQLAQGEMGGSYKDLTFRIDLGNSESYAFGVHRFMLAARSAYFDRQLLGRWRHRSTVKLREANVDPAAFAAVMHHLYTGQVLHTDSPKLQDSIAFVGRHLVWAPLESHDVARIRADVDLFLKQRVLAAAAIVDASYIVQELFLTSSTHTLDTIDALYADVAVWLGDDSVLFPCHKSCLCRCDYFRNMLDGDFSEANMVPSQITYAALAQTLQVPVITLSGVPAHVFPYILEYLYTDRCSVSVDHAYDVLLVADRLLLDRIKAFAAIALTSHHEPPRDIYDLIHVAILLDVDRLEQWCISYFADHLDTFIEQPAFVELIRTSAYSIQARQETDSIPFIDDLRHWLDKKYGVPDATPDIVGGMSFADEDVDPDEDLAPQIDIESTYYRKLAMLDEVLASLGLQG